MKKIMVLFVALFSLSLCTEHLFAIQSGGDYDKTTQEKHKALMAQGNAVRKKKADPVKSEARRQADNKKTRVGNYELFCNLAKKIETTAKGKGNKAYGDAIYEMWNVVLQEILPNSLIKHVNEQLKGKKKIDATVLWDNLNTDRNELFEKMVNTFGCDRVYSALSFKTYALNRLINIFFGVLQQSNRFSDKLNAGDLQKEDVKEKLISTFNQWDDIHGGPSYENINDPVDLKAEKESKSETVPVKGKEK